MESERSCVEANTRERERLRTLVERLGDDELRSQVDEYWMVAGVLGHVAFWDSRALVLADKFESGDPFLPSDHEPENVSWLNDATRPLNHAIPRHPATRSSTARAAPSRGDRPSRCHLAA